MLKNKYLYFGLATVIVEWAGLALGFLYWRHFNPDLALSTATVQSSPLPQIFALTLITAGITYTVFSLALRSYSRLIPYFAALAGLAFALTGITKYTGYGGFQDVVHQICSYAALAGYVAIIWLLRVHPKRHIQVASQVVVGIIVGAIGVAILSNYVFHRYFALVQLLVLFSIQTWTVLVVWHERTPAPVDKLA